MSWWSDKQIFIIPSWEILSGRLANMWSVNDVILQVIRVGDLIICVKPNTAKLKIILDIIRDCH